MIDTAVAFASHGGANSIIITTLSNSLHFHKNVRHQQPGLPITVLTWPRIVKASDINMFAGPTTDTSVLQQPLRQLLEDLNPDAIVVEMFHGWAADVIDELKSQGSSSTAVGVSSRGVFHNVTHYAPHQKLGSDSEPFELTRLQFPPFIRDLSQGGFDWRKKAM